mmetsp:Transcript_12338/g.34201  ORF Transcript_12338/g.34201 Transcript_12338/m.34201 type:complete len:102 (-) Transcript_12338:248-553(-)
MFQFERESGRGKTAVDWECSLASRGSSVSGVYYIEKCETVIASLLRSQFCLNWQNVLSSHFSHTLTYTLSQVAKISSAEKQCPSSWCIGTVVAYLSLQGHI